MAHWNFRVVKYEDHLRVFDVYYDDHGNPKSRNEQPTYIYGESVAELREQIRMIEAAFELPVLDDSTIG